MATRSKDTEAPSETNDYLFTWKPEGWPYEELRKLVDIFQSHGTAEDEWRCAAHHKIRVGDRAYLLKQGEFNRGIFGRGIVIGQAVKSKRVTAGTNPWSVPIRIDVLWDPMEHVLVNEEQLLRLPAPHHRWSTQASGVTLDRDAARQIDAIIDSVLTDGTTPKGGMVSNGAAQEIARLRAMGEVATRPGQKAFCETIRTNYGNACAFTGCTTLAALQAAHICSQEGIDDNNPENGLLMRSDIHALFDAFLITLSQDGTTVELSPELTDASYAFLRTVTVSLPKRGPRPSRENIREHRDRFSERQK